MSRVLILGALPESLLTFRWALIEALRDAGHEVVTAAGVPITEVAGTLKARGLDCYPVRMQRTGVNPAADLVTLWDCYLVMRKVSPDVVLCYTAKPVIYGLIAARWAKVSRLVAMIEGLGFAFTGSSLKHRLLGLVLRLLYRASLARCNDVFFLNPDDQAFFSAQNLLGRQCAQARISGIGVDLGHFVPMPLPSTPTFLLVARLLKDKGVVEYVEAAKRVKIRYPSAKFLLAGWLDENPSCISKALLDGWIESGVIDYLGRLEDVRPAYGQCSVYVLPSYREGLPVTIMEAMATGRAIVATDVPGCRETVVDGVNGFLAPSRNADALAEVLLRFLDEPALTARMGVESRRLAEKRFDVVRINDQIMQTLGLK